MSRPSPLVVAFASAATLLPSAAVAHTGVGAAAGFARGFLHPITGQDHVLAMVMVGVFACQLGGRALWLVPASFMTLMAVGAALGVAGIGLPFVEAGVALSVIVLGAVVALAIPVSTAAAMAVVGLSAIFHGHAHGTEMPETVAGVVYGLGLVLGTGLLHGSGIGLGHVLGWAAKRQSAVLLRATGAAAALAGITILAGIV